MQGYKEYTFSLKQSMTIIFGSVLLVCLVVFGVIFFQHVRSEKRSRDERYTVVAIEQRCRSKDALNGIYLAELLELSVDKPLNFYLFQTKEAEKKLLACPAVKKAQVKVFKPGVVFVDYELRAPVAIVADYKNMGIDNEQNPFPLTPYFTQKNIPQLHLGVPVQWGVPVEGREIALALEIVELSKSGLFPSSYALCMVDVKSSFKSSATQEVVVLLEQKLGQESKLHVQSYLLRMLRRNYKESLRNFFALQETFQKLQPAVLTAGRCIKMPVQVIDFRVSQLALVKSEVYEWR